MKKLGKISSKNLKIIQKAETTWDIFLKKEERVIGSIVADEKPNEKYEVNLSVSIEERYRKKNYGLEAMREMISWIFANTEAYYIMAEVKAENLPAHGLLEKLGFVKVENDNRDIMIYELERPIVKYMVIYYLLGMSCGTCFGVTCGNTALGMCAGLGFGALLGIALDKNDKKKREEIKNLRRKVEEK